MRNGVVACSLRLRSKRSMRFFVAGQSVSTAQSILGRTDGTLTTPSDPRLCSSKGPVLEVRRRPVQQEAPGAVPEVYPRNHRSGYQPALFGVAAQGLGKRGNCSFETLPVPCLNLHLTLLSIASLHVWSKGLVVEPVDICVGVDVVWRKWGRSMSGISPSMLQRRHVGWFYQRAHDDHIYIS